MTAGPRFDHYDWAGRGSTGGREAMLRFGPEDGPIVIVAPPLFEEANRTRALIVAMLRGLAARGIGGALPDLPGQGESGATLLGTSLAAWRRAFARAVSSLGERCYVVAMRGGALVDGKAQAAARLHLSPASGAALVRGLLRARRAATLAAGERPVADDLDKPGPPLLLAGNLIGRDLLRDLMAAAPGRADRKVTIFPDTDPSDRALAPDHAASGSGEPARYRKPWLASEPFVDADLAEALATDIAQWVAACGG